MQNSRQQLEALRDAAEKTRALLKTRYRGQQVELRGALSDMLNTLLELTGAEFGLMGETFTSQAEPYLVTLGLAIGAGQSRGGLPRADIRGLRFGPEAGLIGEMLLKRSTWTFTAKSEDEVRVVSREHPPVHSFLGIPLFLEGKMSGLVCLINRPGGFDEAVAGALAPLIERYQHMVELGVSRQRYQETAQALLRSRSEYALIFNEASEPIFRADPEGRIADANPAAHALLGYGDGALVGRSFSDLLAPSERSATAQLLKEGAKETQRHRRQTLLHRGGGEVAVQCSVRRLSDGSLLIVCHDLRRAFRDQAERSRAERMEALGHLSAAVAHEINNPLSYVVHNLSELHGALKLLAELSASPEQRGPPALAAAAKSAGLDLLRFEELAESASDALAGAHRIRDTVSALQSFAFIEDDVIGPIDLNQVVRAAVHLSQTQTRYHVQFDTQLCPAPMVMANEGRLTQCLVELFLSIAGEMRPRDDENKVISVSIEPIRGQVEIEIAVDGGSSDAPQLFGAAEAATSPVGLQIALMRQLLAATGGETRVIERPGAAPSLRLSLPCEEYLPAPATPPPTLPPSAGPAHILVVDDEILVAELLVSALGELGEISVAHSGQETLERLAEGQRFDLIISDLMMPGLSGIELHAALEELQPEHAESMLFMTGGAFSPEAQRFVATHRARVLKKPFEFETLVAQVQAALPISAEGTGPAREASR